jgi:hypothetical protein
MTTSNHADKTKSCSLLLPPAPSLRTLGRRSRCPLRCRPSWAAEPAGCKRARIEADLAHEDERGVGDYLSSEVLEDGGEVDGCTGADMLRVLAGLEVTRDTAPTGNWSRPWRTWTPTWWPASPCRGRRLRWNSSSLCLGGLEASEPFEAFGTAQLVETGGGLLLRWISKWTS